MILEIGCPLDKNVTDTETEKATKYDALERDLRRQKTARGEDGKIRTVPIAIGCTGLVTDKIKTYLNSLELDLKLVDLQKTAATHTIQILSKQR